MQDFEVFSAIGEAGFSRLTAAFYRRVPADAILGPMYPAEDLAGAERRLCDFLVFRFGGPQRYLAARGHPRLRMRHMRFPVTQEARDRWVALMNEAIAEAALPPEPAATLHEFFTAMATFLMNAETPPQR